MRLLRKTLKNCSSVMNFNVNDPPWHIEFDWWEFKEKKIKVFVLESKRFFLNKFWRPN